MYISLIFGTCRFRTNNIDQAQKKNIRTDVFSEKNMLFTRKDLPRLLLGQIELSDKAGTENIFSELSQ